MRGAGDTGVVVPNHLLALPPELSVGQVHARLNEPAQVVFDGGLDEPCFTFWNEDLTEVNPEVQASKPFSTKSSKSFSTKARR